MSNGVLYLPEYVGVAEMERALRERSSFSVGDFRDAEEFDVVALMLLLAAIARRPDPERLTLQLPRDDLARHLLRSWGFPEAVSEVTQVAFRALASREDLGYFGEPAPRITVASDGADTRADVLAYLIERRFFGLSTYRLDAEHDVASIMRREVARWRDFAMDALLEKTLYGGAGDVARVIMQELVANVVEHAEPSLAVIGSQLDLLEHVDAEGIVEPGLTVSIWDDGTSTVRRLRARLEEGGIRMWSPDNPDRFVVDSDAWPSACREYTAAWTPDASSSDAEILLASLFPGISRKAGTPEAAEVPMGYGYGLPAVYKTAVDDFRGSLELRCDGTTISLSRPEGTGPYLVLGHVDHEAPANAGTLVTARLPIRDG